ncbi:MAG: GspH/FimT family pseudopilin [Salinisphaeraceae bacterium]
MIGPFFQKGFTLLDALVVIAVLAVALGLGTPAFDHYIKASSVRTSASELQKAFILARTAAIERAVPVYVYPDASWGKGFAVTVAQNKTPESCSKDSTDCLHHMTPSEFSRAKIRATDAAIEFLPTGESTTPTTLIVCAEDYGDLRTIHLLASGRTFVLPDTGACDAS